MKQVKTAYPAHLDLQAQGATLEKKALLGPPVHQVHLENLEKEDRPDLQDQLDSKVYLVWLVILDNPEKMASLVYQDLQDLQVLLVNAEKEDSQEKEDYKDPKGHPAPEEKVDLLGKMELEDHQEIKEPKVTLDPVACSDYPDQEVNPVLEELRAIVEIMDHPALKALLGDLGNKGLRVLLELPDHLGNLEKKVNLAPLVPMVNKDPLECKVKEAL